MGSTVLLFLAVLAQSPADRAALEALRDSLSTVTDSAALQRLETTTIAYARQHRDEPMIHLRLGFIAYRLGEISTTKSHYDDAAGEFEWATELRPEWPYPWYGLGLAELAVGENASIALENIRQMLGKDYLSKAARAFAHATEVDPSFAFAVVDLANTALTQRIKPRLDVALLELARTYYFARRSPDGWRAYLAGARAATSAPALTLYRSDLSWIADSG